MCHSNTTDLTDLAEKCVCSYTEKRNLTAQQFLASKFLGLNSVDFVRHSTGPVSNF